MLCLQSGKSGPVSLLRDLSFQARHFAHGNVGCTVDWLRGTFKAAPKQHVMRSCALIVSMRRRACRPVDGLGHSVTIHASDRTRR